LHTASRAVAHVEVSTTDLDGLCARLMARDVEFDSAEASRFFADPRSSHGGLQSGFSRDIRSVTWKLVGSAASRLRGTRESKAKSIKNPNSFTGTTIVDSAVNLPRFSTIVSTITMGRRTQACYNVTPAGIAAEGRAIGTIVVGVQRLVVTVVVGPSP
jgi:hypothetical protein